MQGNFLVILKDTPTKILKCGDANFTLTIFLAYFVFNIFPRHSKEFLHLSSAVLQNGMVFTRFSMINIFSNFQNRTFNLWQLL